MLSQSPMHPSKISNFDGCDPVPVQIPHRISGKGAENHISPATCREGRSMKDHKKRNPQIEFQFQQPKSQGNRCQQQNQQISKYENLFSFVLGFTWSWFKFSLRLVRGLSKVCFVNVWRYLRLLFGFIQEDRLLSFCYTAGKDQPVLVTSLAEIDTLQDSAQGGGGGRLELAKPPVDFLLSGRSPSVFLLCCWERSSCQRLFWSQVWLKLIPLTPSFSTFCVGTSALEETVPSSGWHASVQKN